MGSAKIYARDKDFTNILMNYLRVLVEKVLQFLSYILGAIRIWIIFCKSSDNKQTKKNCIKKNKNHKTGRNNDSNSESLKVY